MDCIDFKVIFSFLVPVRRKIKKKKKAGTRQKGGGEQLEVRVKFRLIIKQLNAMLQIES